MTETSKNHELLLTVRMMDNQNHELAKVSDIQNWIGRSWPVGKMEAGRELSWLNDWGS
jgi:hypothetical protein